MGFLDSVRKFFQDLSEVDVDEMRRVERLKVENEAYLASKPTDEYVTVKIQGDGELNRMAQAGWEVVTKTETSEYTWLNRYLLRKKRDELAKSLGIVA
jgi:hypothetical protein